MGRGGDGADHQRVLDRNSEEHRILGLLARDRSGAHGRSAARNLPVDNMRTSGVPSGRLTPTANEV